MQDYNINVNYNNINQSSPRTSPNYIRNITDKTQAVRTNDKGNILPTGIRRVGTVALAASAKINSYVGELTENTVSARKRQLGIMAGGLALAATANPLMALVAGGMFVADRAIQYNIKQYKENLNAEFARQLSGGTVNTRR